MTNVGKRPLTYWIFMAVATGFIVVVTIGSIWAVAWTATDPDLTTELPWLPFAVVPVWSLAAVVFAAFVIKRGWQAPHEPAKRPTS